MLNSWDSVLTYFPSFRYAEMRFIFIKHVTRQWIHGLPSMISWTVKWLGDSQSNDIKDVRYACVLQTHWFLSANYSPSMLLVTRTWYLWRLWSLLKVFSSWKKRNSFFLASPILKASCTPKTVYFEVWKPRQKRFTVTQSQPRIRREPSITEIGDIFNSWQSDPMNCTCK